MELERWVEVSNKFGLHARVATELVKLSSQFESSVTLTREGSEEEVDGKSILALMTMGAENGAKLLLRVSGDDAERACSAISDLFGQSFDD
jgi:phosphotransferase system HPr (HPr) family protein